MNKIILSGRISGECKISKSIEGTITAARCRLAVERRVKKDGQPSADFVSCILFGKQAELAEKYLCQGIKILISGRLQTGYYINEEGQKVYSTEVIVEELDFAESKSVNEKWLKKASKKREGIEADAEGFMNIPEDEEKLPFT